MHVINSLLKQQFYHPNDIAFREQGREVSYRGFFTRAERVSEALVHNGVSHGDRVAVLLPRGIDAACSIYGALFAGACYVPLDIKNPVSRLAFIITDVKARCVIGQGDRPDWFDESVTWLRVDELKLSEDRPYEDVDVIYRSAPDDLTAVLYTSGSTGTPKGVCISCRAIDAFVNWSTATFDLGAEDRIASLAPFHFDLSLFDLFTAVHCGAVTSFIPQSLVLAPRKLAAWLEGEGITSWYTVPSILGFLAQRGGLKSESLPAMKRILFAGEVFPVSGLKRLADALPHVALYNLFGPTETNVCTYWPVDRPRLSQLESVPIGEAACAAELKIDNDGGLLVKGPCLMSRYWHNGAVIPAVKNGWYQTGDRVSKNDHGELLYHGRMDRMLKSSGYRIEPAEIEAVINRFEHVIESVIIGVSDPISGQRLVAAVVGDDLNMDGLRAYIRENIPAYMQPYRIVLVDAFPRLSNGKLDYHAVEALI